MITIENTSQKSITRTCRSVHQTGFLWGLVQALVRSTTHRFSAVRVPV